MQIRYEFQQNKQLIGSDEFNFDDVSFHYNIHSIPTMQVYDRNHNLVESYIGLVREGELTQTIERLLSVK